MPWRQEMEKSFFSILLNHIDLIDFNETLRRKRNLS